MATKRKTSSEFQVPSFELPIANVGDTDEVVAEVVVEPTLPTLPEPEPEPIPEPPAKKVKAPVVVVVPEPPARPQPHDIVRVKLVGAPQAVLIVASGQAVTVIKGESHQARYAHYRQAWQVNKQAWQVKYPGAAAFITETD